MQVFAHHFLENGKEFPIGNETVFVYVVDPVLVKVENRDFYIPVCRVNVPSPS